MRRIFENLGFGRNPEDRKDSEQERGKEKRANWTESAPERGDERMARTIETPQDDTSNDSNDFDATDELPADPAETDTTEDI
jgi:hypothetical protein